MQLLKVARLELKSKRKYSRSFIFVLLISAVITLVLLFCILKFGIKIDSCIYSSNVDLENRLFCLSTDPDIEIADGKVVVRGDFKSYSAFDEFREYLRSEYNEWLYEKYGERAFPVTVEIIKVPTTAKIIPEISKIKIKPEKTESTYKKSKKPVEYSKTGGGGKVSPKEKLSEKKEFSGIKAVIPDNLRPPILIKELIMAFIIVMPFYFISQVYTSSFMEDKVKERFDILISSAGRYSALLGKLAPYLFISAVVSLILSNFDPLISFLAFTIAFFMLTFGCFLSFISRSYKELTFLTIVVTFIITTYLFIPAVFTVVPLSKISPVTLIFLKLKGEVLDVKDIIVSSAVLYLISFTLLYISSTSVEIMYSRANPVEKVIAISHELINNYPSLFLASILSIPFVFLIELFTLNLIFSFSSYLLIVLTAMALIEEFFKGTFVYSAFKNNLNVYLSAVISAVGFAMGEKIIVLPFLPFELFRFILFPLAAHVASSLVFALLIRLGFYRALLFSTGVHTLYNFAVMRLMIP